MIAETGSNRILSYLVKLPVFSDILKNASQRLISSEC